MDLPNSIYFKERVHRSYRDKFTLVWMVNRDCNFNCAYCYGTDEKPVDFDHDEFVEKLLTVPQPCRLVITGGEPFLRPGMVDLIVKLGAAGISVEIQTNLTLCVNDLLDRADPSYVEIIETSFHPDARREWGGQQAIDEFVSSYLYAEEKGFRITTWLIDDSRIGPERFLEECAYLHSYGITPYRKRYCGDEGDGGTGDAIWVPGKRCRAGHFGVSLWENFDMSPCDHDRTVLGNLFTGFQLYDEPRPCAKPFCGCLGREWLVDKFYDEYYEKEFGG